MSLKLQRLAFLCADSRVSSVCGVQSSRLSGRDGITLPKSVSGFTSSLYHTTQSSVIQTDVRDSRAQSGADVGPSDACLPPPAGHHPERTEGHACVLVH